MTDSFLHMKFWPSSILFVAEKIKQLLECLVNTVVDAYIAEEKSVDCGFAKQIQGREAGERFPEKLVQEVEDVPELARKGKTQL